jgi:predicted cupin superfamily sugar epimerase
MHARSEELIRILGLSPHPEGGHFKETYRSPEIIFSPDHEDGRNICTSILFLLETGTFSAFHRIDSDELWNFHEGDACLIHVLHHQGGYSLIRLGSNLRESEVFQALVNAGDWFASETTGNYSLVGCTVSPGFDFRYFTLAERSELLRDYPGHEEIIAGLVR